MDNEAAYKKLEEEATAQLKQAADVGDGVDKAVYMLHLKTVDGHEAAIDAIKEMGIEAPDFVFAYIKIFTANLVSAIGPMPHKAQTAVAMKFVSELMRANRIAEEVAENLKGRKN